MIPILSKLTLLIVLSLVAIPEYSLRVNPEAIGGFSFYSQSKNTYKTPSLSANFASVHSTNRSVIFVGDVLMARNVESLMGRHSPQYPFAGVDFSQIAVDPYVFGNFEAAVPTDHKRTPAGSIQFSVATTNISHLKDAGFTHLSLANNHSYDFGTSDYINTIKSLFQEDLVPFGHPRNIYDHSRVDLELGNTVLSVFGLHTLFGEPDFGKLSQDFNRANENSDFQVAYVHWGDEYQESSSEHQREYAVKLVALGFDLIVGHHPHVTQEIDLIEGVPVIYSLGNYIFDQYFSVEVQQGLMIKLSFDNEPYISLIPVTSEEVASQPHMMSPPSHRLFLNDLAQKSDERLSSDIREGRIFLNKVVATSSKMAIMNP